MQKVVVMDTNPIVSLAITELLENNRFTDVTHISNLSELKAVLETEAVDVVIMDLFDGNSYPINGLDFIKQHRPLLEELKLIVFTDIDCYFIVNEISKFKNVNLISKRESLSELLFALCKRESKKPYLSPFMSKSKELNWKNHLTSTELRVLYLLIDNQTPNQICETLNLHYKTVLFHKSNIARKVGARNSLQLAKILTSFTNYNRHAPYRTVGF
ncbi:MULTISPECIES: response regulator transcription factor [Pantoea]|nr:MULTISPECIES: response regulator transcription factor [Pantoea]